MTTTWKHPTWHTSGDAKACVQCGAQFRRRYGDNLERWQQRRFCSLACRGESFRKVRPTKVCSYCGAAFQRSGKETDDKWAARKFCDRTCGARGRRIRSLYERLWAKVQTGWESDCWEFKGASGDAGHGHLGPSGASQRHHQAHRVAWEFFYGPIPDGLYVCHHCDNPPCCNPAHLFLGTQADNMRDMIRKGRASHQRVITNG